MVNQRILVVDDEESILKVIAYALRQEGYEVVTAGDAAGAEAILALEQPALVILDVMLPDRSGLEVARELRGRSNVPIIMVSARADEVDRILGLEFGADDYVTKPFSPRELVSRVKSLLRRAAACGEEPASIRVGELVIDTASRQASVSGLPVPLTPTEYQILLHLARHPGTAFSREAIMTELRDIEGTGEERGDAHAGDERAVDVHVHNIREKVEPDPKNPTYLLTVRGFGYRLKSA